VTSEILDGTGTGGNGGIGGRTFTGVPIGSTITYLVGSIRTSPVYAAADYSYVTVNGITIYASGGGGGAQYISEYPTYEVNNIPGYDGLGVPSALGGTGGKAVLGQHAGQPGTTNYSGGTNPGNAYGRGGVGFTAPTGGYVSITM
jgi:hypothetical protein